MLELTPSAENIGASPLRSSRCSPDREVMSVFKQVVEHPCNPLFLALAGHFTGARPRASGC